MPFFAAPEANSAISAGTQPHVLSQSAVWGQYEMIPPNSLTERCVRPTLYFPAALLNPPRTARRCCHGTDHLLHRYRGHWQNHFGYFRQISAKSNQTTCAGRACSSRRTAAQTNTPPTAARSTTITDRPAQVPCRQRTKTPQYSRGCSLRDPTKAVRCRRSAARRSLRLRSRAHSSRLHRRRLCQTAHQSACSGSYWQRYKRRSSRLRWHRYQPFSQYSQILP